MDSRFNAFHQELHNVQMEVKQVQFVQANHAERLLRLERRQADDAAIKSVWNSPFPSVLGGTPQHGKHLVLKLLVLSHLMGFPKVLSNYLPMRTLTISTSKARIFLAPCTWRPTMSPSAAGQHPGPTAFVSTRVPCKVQTGARARGILESFTLDPEAG